MNVAAIVSMISKMDDEWFKNQEVRFKNESQYNKHLQKIYNLIPHNEYDGKGKVIDTSEEIIDIEFLDYCFNSFFNWSDKQLFLLTSDYEYPYIDGLDIVNFIKRLIDVEVLKFTDLKASDIFIKEIDTLILISVQKLKNSNKNSNYLKYLDLFMSEKDEIFTSAFAHIQTQIRLLQSDLKIDQNLNYSICQKIAEFKIKNKRLITSVVPAQQDNAQVLLFLLTNTGEVQPKTRFLIEDWAVQDFYYLLLLIVKYFSNISTISKIEKNKGFQLKTEKFFASNSFYKFKSDNLSAYIDRNQSHSLINDLMRLYKR